MFTNDKQDASLEVTDPNAVKPARKQGALKQLLKQLQSTGTPPLEGEEVLPPKLIGSGNYHWYALAWTRWLVRWEQFRTLVLVVVLVALCGIWAVMTRRVKVQVNLPRPSEEMLLTANKFASFDRQNVEAFMQFAICAANQSSAEGMPAACLLEGSIEPSIFLQIQQRASGKNPYGAPPADLPIYTVYVSKYTHWSYNARNRVVSAYAQGFRMMNTISGQNKMEPYRAMIDVFLEPTSNRNRWGYYIQKFDEYLRRGRGHVRCRFGPRFSAERQHAVAVGEQPGPQRRAHQSGRAGDPDRHPRRCSQRHDSPAFPRLLSLTTARSRRKACTSAAT